MKMLFGEMSLPLIDKAKALKWLENLKEELWFWDDYRNCSMLSLMNQTGDMTKEGSKNENKKSNFLWTKCAPPFIKAYFEKHVWTWTKMKSRIIVIRTRPGQSHFVHIDCSPDKFKTIQHKFRIVLQGQTDSLYFETSKGKIYAPQTEKPFIMDGSWPHGMTNTSPLTKYTLCLGAPWSHSDYYPGLKPLIYARAKDLPSSYQQYFNPKYKNKAYGS